MLSRLGALDTKLDQSSRSIVQLEEVISRVSTQINSLSTQMAGLQTTIDNCYRVFEQVSNRLNEPQDNVDFGSSGYEPSGNNYNLT